MAFWGIEVKPGKPVTHFSEKARGRLRISQATLGISDATSKSIVQCNVGMRSPVLLCVLLPNHTESCHLDLEFEEADDVVFSVLGPRSVYLTGYYVRDASKQSNPQSDSESYGVNIEDTQTEESSFRSDDDEYEDSFIDDDELQDFSPPPVLNDKVMDETTSEDDMLKNRKGRGRRLKKKCQVVESDTDVSSHESEDEDGHLLSVFKNKKATKSTLSGVESNNVNQELPTSNGKYQLHSLDIGKQTKKRKEHPKEGKTCEVQIGKSFGAPKEDKKHEAKASKNLEIGDHDLVPLPESSTEYCKKSKKRRKEKLEGMSTKRIGLKLAIDDEFRQDLFHPLSQKKNLPAATGDQEQQIDNNVSMKFELPANSDQPKKKTKKKTKKKKNQSGGDSNMSLPNMSDNQDTKLTAIEDQPTNEKPMQNRTLSNGLVIEEVANGPPNGKVATQGKKVKIFYTGTLKENGHVFDSNEGKKAYKFRLGDEGIINGWNLGIEGMHVGDKRRLTIPPSMGFGKHGGGENVPPNSWLVYDVELVGVIHK